MDYPSVTYDAEADAAYIAFCPRIESCVMRTLEATAAQDIILDFDQSDRLVGVEVLVASSRLPADLLREPESCGKYLPGHGLEVHG